MAQNIDERATTTREAIDMLKSLRLMFQHHPAPVAVADAKSECAALVFVNPAFEEMTGYRASEMIGRNCRFLQGADKDQPGLMLLRDALTTHSQTDVVLRNYRKNGELFINHITLSPVKDSRDEVQFVLSTSRDITAEQKLQDRLMEAQAKDSLTGALNRPHFWRMAETILQRAHTQKVPLTVIQFDVDHLTAINDEYGFASGDKVLQEFVKTARLEMRRTDVMARLGSDEFAIVLPGVQLGAARGIAKAIRKRVEKLKLPAREQDSFSFTVSAGVAECLYEIESLDYALYRADQAMLQARRAGRNRVASY